MILFRNRRSKCNDSFDTTKDSSSANHNHSNEYVADCDHRDKNQVEASSMNQINGAVFHKGSIYIYSIVVILAILICASYFFLFKDLAEEYLLLFKLFRSDNSNTLLKYAMFYVVSQTVIECALWIVLTICILGQISNQAFRKVYFGFIINNVIVMSLILVLYLTNSEYIKDDRANTIKLLLEYSVMPLSNVMMTWLLRAKNKPILKKIWFLPGIIASFSILRVIKDIPNFIESSFSSISNFFIAFVPMFGVAVFSFCFMKWATIRNEGKVGVVVNPQAKRIIDTPNTAIACQSTKYDVNKIPQNRYSVVCHACGSMINIRDRYCSNCGGVNILSFCSRCGSVNASNNRFCENCGAMIKH